MIQRIQSLYLLLTSLLAGLFLSGTFLKFFNKSGSEFLINIRGLWQSEAPGDPHMIKIVILVAAIMILIIIVSLAAIFLYKKRKIQMKLAGAVMLLAIFLIGLMLYGIFRVTGESGAKLVPVYRMFIPVLILIFGILAYMGIRKDENLVKSLDRLR